jgi:hypothetical protein
MAAVTVRNLPEEARRALKVRAARHGRSTEIGSELAAFGRRLGGVDLDASRDRTPTEPATFE